MGGAGRRKQLVPYPPPGNLQPKTGPQEEHRQGLVTCTPRRHPGTRASPGVAQGSARTASSVRTGRKGLAAGPGSRPGTGQGGPAGQSLPSTRTLLPGAQSPSSSRYRDGDSLAPGDFPQTCKRATPLLFCLSCSWVCCFSERRFKMIPRPKGPIWGQHVCCATARTFQGLHPVVPIPTSPSPCGTHGPCTRPLWLSWDCLLEPEEGTRNRPGPRGHSPSVRPGVSRTPEVTSSTEGGARPQTRGLRVRGTGWQLRARPCHKVRAHHGAPEAAWVGFCGL